MCSEDQAARDAAVEIELENGTKLSQIIRLSVGGPRLKEIDVKLKNVMLSRNHKIRIDCPSCKARL